VSAAAFGALRRAAELAYRWAKLSRV